MGVITWCWADPERAEREWQAFFGSVPQCVGMSGDLPETGAFLTSHDLGVPILATRDADGAFRLSRELALDEALTVTLTISGNATRAGRCSNWDAI